ncbi:MAG: mannose-1-phosphate guanylyltransferase [Candidatus Shapirobacteria bacterium]|nr:mannose-1-phosphate guanylyltransferase [Candidatus Shapirobacteria bacterium]
MAESSIKHYIFILCGGTGPRLWPLSRKNNPKQFLPLLDKKSILEQTIKRSQRTVDTQNIYIVSGQNYFDKIIKIAKDFNLTKNVIIEPEKKNTAMAILYSVARIKQIDPNAIISTLPSDHYIKNIARFKQTLTKAKRVAQLTDTIVTIGIKPTKPDSSYGYICPDKKIDDYYHVAKFIEKPDPVKAQKLIDKNSYWNSGIYTFSVSTILSEFEKLQPEYFAIFKDLEKNLNYPKKIEQIYKQSPELSIDRAISEKSSKMTMVPATFDWSDIGEWETIFASSIKRKDDLAIINPDTQFLNINSQKCLISGQRKKLIGLVGVNNLAIIDTSDALLVCNLDSSFSVRDLVSLMVKNKKYKTYFLG